MANGGGNDILRTVREDDYVEFYIFPNITNENKNNEEVILRKYLEDVNELIKNYAKEYIWHKDGFNLHIRNKDSHLLSEDEEDSPLPGHLYGVLHFGDNIEDEWFLTFLLYQVSLKFEELVIRLIDNDGEYLLIEAANFLPSWADPDTCDKRVYLYKGKIHIIPNTEISSNDTEISVSEALKIIRTKFLLTEASTQIQEAILNRINGYPKKITENFHHAKAYLPINVAAILNAHPNLISHCVAAFCNRDSIDMKACRAMKFFPPENRIFSRVKFTRCQYAQIINSKYVPDLRIGWNLPNVNSPDYKPSLLGVKIACGFEILASQAKKSESLENNKNWLQYLDSLKKKNYFKDLLENSQEYNSLLETAKDYFKNNQESLHVNQSLGQKILDINRNLDINIDDLKKLESNLASDDDENWLKIDPKELENLLEQKYGTKTNFEPNSKNICQKLNQFLESTSGIEGVEFPKEDFGSPVRPKRGIKKSKKPEKSTDQTDQQSTSNKINFDPLNFSCAVQNILDLMIPEDSWDLESGSELSEYDSDNENVDFLDPKNANNKNKLKIKEYMEAMDRELANTSVKSEGDKFDDIESFEPVNIDMSVLKNVLESYESQMGASGPITNMLGPMGVHLEKSGSSGTKSNENS